MKEIRKSCFNYACEQHTCSTNTCILEQYGRFTFANTYGQKYKFRSTACLKYYLKMIDWKLKR